jgi:hypothetical protein
MNGQNQENFKELFEQFLAPEQAAIAVEDMLKAEQILRENPAPEPDELLIADIKWQIEEALAARKPAWNFRSIAYRVAVAAAIIVVAAIGTRFLLKGPEDAGKTVYASIIPRAIWDTDDITTADAELATLTAEIQQVEDEVLTLELGERHGNGERAVAELEMQLIAINSNFWEG